MARKHSSSTNDTRPEGAQVDEHHGVGGSYVNTEDGKRVLVERTEQRVVRSVEQEEQAATEKDKAPQGE
jgi:hypothetical protein